MTYFTFYAFNAELYIFSNKEFFISNCMLACSVSSLVYLTFSTTLLFIWYVTFVSYCIRTREEFCMNSWLFKVLFMFVFAAVNLKPLSKYLNFVNKIKFIFSHKIDSLI